MIMNSGTGARLLDVKISFEKADQQSIIRPKYKKIRKRQVALGRGKTDVIKEKFEESEEGSTLKAWATRRTKRSKLRVGRILKYLSVESGEIKRFFSKGESSEEIINTA